MTHRLPSPEILAKKLETVFLSPGTQYDLLKDEDGLDDYRALLHGHETDDTRRNVRWKLHELMQRTEALSLGDILPLIAENREILPENDRLTLLHGLVRRAYQALQQKDQTLPPLDTTEWDLDHQRVLHVDDADVVEGMGAALDILMRKHGL